MSQPIKIYTDEQIDGAIIAGLRRRGIDVLTTPEAGLMSAPDEVHLTRAASEGRVLLTQDYDFTIINARGVAHSGIIFADQSLSIGDIIRGVQNLHRDRTVDEMQNVLYYLPRNI